MPDVDAKLVRMSLDRNCALLTFDTNLAKAAAIAGVKVMNLHSLALALRPPVVVGDEVDRHLLKAGKEAGQAVGYLDDGTMVVAERARDKVGTECRVVVTSVLTTANGRLVFARPDEARERPPGESNGRDRPRRGAWRAARPGGAEGAAHARRGPDARARRARARLARSVDLVVVAGAPADVVALRRALLADAGRAEVVVVAGGDTRQESVARARRRCPPTSTSSSSTTRPARSPRRARRPGGRGRPRRRRGGRAGPAGRRHPQVRRRVASVVRARSTVRRCGRSRHLRGSVARCSAAAHAAADRGDLRPTTRALVERLGGTVLVVPGDEEAFKVTRPFDLVLAEAVLARRRAAGVVV